MDTQTSGGTSAPIKMYRGTDRLVVAAAMAGMEPKDVQVQVTRDGYLSMHGNTVGELKGDKEILMDEWNPGPYHREIELPNPVDADLANLTYRNGVLVISLPLSSETRPAVLTLESVGPAYGERVGSHGRPVEPTNAAEHHESGGHKPMNSAH